MFKKDKKGFTLIELIVVIAIILILLLLLIPRGAGFVDTTKKVVCNSNVHLVNRAYKVAEALGSTITAPMQFLDGTDPNSMYKGEPICPIHGKTSIQFNSAKNLFYCTEHNDDPGSGGGGEEPEPPKDEDIGNIDIKDTFDRDIELKLSFPEGNFETLDIQMNKQIIKNSIVFYKGKYYMINKDNTGFNSATETREQLLERIAVPIDIKPNMTDKSMVSPSNPTPYGGIADGTFVPTPGGEQYFICVNKNGCTNKNNAADWYRIISERYR